MRADLWRWYHCGGWYTQPRRAIGQVGPQVEQSPGSSHSKVEISLLELMSQLFVTKLLYRATFCKILNMAVRHSV